MIYVEKSLLNHPRTKTICSLMPKRSIIEIDHYGEVFNRHGQHFRLQKKRPAFILAKKKGKLLYEIPPNYGIGAKKNFYFSHILNCPYDCSYCFLQGMYRSASYVIFINFEDFQDAIMEKIGEIKTTFFSGYDGDSLALDSCSGFLDSFLPFFERFPKAELELRTKSIHIDKLLKTKPLPNIIVAFSLNPSAIVKNIEKKTPSLDARLKCLQKLQQHGWQIGLRFDPILYIQDFEKIYRIFFDQVFNHVSERAIHSITLGALRLPKQIFKEMQALKPKDNLLSQLSASSKNTMSMEQEGDLLSFCESYLLKYTSKEKVFVCR